jgi:hypothetical protein
MKLRLITFKTNQTVLGNVSGENPAFIVMEKPVQVIVQPTKDGPMMGFSPFLEYSEEFNTGINFKVEDILCVTTPVTELQNQYSQMFGSGIQIASSIPKY